MCSNGSSCFEKEEKEKLTTKGWTKEQIDFAEHSIIEYKIKELI